MKKSTSKFPALTIGMDLSDKHAQLCYLDEAGSKVKESRVALTAEALRQRFTLKQTARVVIEAGGQSAWVERVVQSCGHEVIVANPRKVRAIFQNDNKSDRVDAEYLARIGRADPQLLFPIRHRGEKAQVDLTVLRGRSALVASRTQLINTVRSQSKVFGNRLPSCSSESFPKHVTPLIPAPLKAALMPLVRTIAQLNRTISRMDQGVERLCAKRYPETGSLRQVDGVGGVTSLTFVLTLDDPYRFKTSRSVGAFLGLRPARDESGGPGPELGITKAGDQTLRRLLVQSAHYILGPFGKDSDLRRWGLQLTTRGKKNAKKRAVIAVARKLAILLHRLWVTGEEYEPLRQSNRRSNAASPVSA